MKTLSFPHLILLTGLLLIFSLNKAFGQKKINLSDAKSYIGDSVVLHGNLLRVEKIKNRPFSTLLTITDGKNHLSILADRTPQTEIPVANTFISVQGKLENWKKKIAIRVSDPKDIRFEPPVLLDTPRPQEF